MTGLVRKASLLVVLGLLVTAAVAGAGIPDPAQSIVPTFIDLVGCKAGVADPYGAFAVTVNDAAGNPVQGCEVDVVFASDLKVYNAMTGLTVDCGARSVTAVSDATGIASFTITGATINTNGVVAGSGLNGATIYACEIALGQATVCVFDQSGAVSGLGVSAIDLSGWVGDFAKLGTQGYKGRSDYDHNGTISAIDLAFWVKVFALGNSAAGCGTLCVY